MFGFINPIVLIATLAALALLLLYLRFRKPRQKREPELVSEPVNTPVEPVLTQGKFTPGRFCRCGVGPMPLKELQKHVLVNGRKEKGKHGFVPLPALLSQPPVSQKGDAAQVSKDGKYWAYVWEPNPGITLVKITKPLGTIWMGETTLPKSGGCYFCKRDPQGNLIPYDPRREPYDPEKSPGRLFRATNATEVVNPVYTTASTLWEKINVIAPYLISALIVIAIFMKIGSK